MHMHACIACTAPSVPLCTTRHGHAKVRGVPLICSLFRRGLNRHAVSQWHPEKPPFEFSDLTIPHTHDAISVSQHMANMFVDYSRQSAHAPVSKEEELAMLIYNTRAVFTARDIVMEPSYDGCASVPSHLPFCAGVPLFHGTFAKFLGLWFASETCMIRACESTCCCCCSCTCCCCSHACHFIEACKPAGSGQCRKCSCLCLQQFGVLLADPWGLCSDNVWLVCRPDITYFLDGEESVEEGLPTFTLTKFN